MGHTRPWPRRSAKRCRRLGRSRQGADVQGARRTQRELRGTCPTLLHPRAGGSGGAMDSTLQVMETHYLTTFSPSLLVPLLFRARVRFSAAPHPIFARMERPELVTGFLSEFHAHMYHYRWAIPWNCTAVCTIRLASSAHTCSEQPWPYHGPDPQLSPRAAAQGCQPPPEAA